MAEIFIDFVIQGSPFNIVQEKLMSGFSGWIKNQNIKKIKIMHICFVTVICLCIQKNGKNLKNNLAYDHSNGLVSIFDIEETVRICYSQKT